MVKVVLGAVFLGLLASLPVGTAEAKPKQTYNGCTQTQLQTPQAGQCLSQVTGDLAGC